MENKTRINFWVDVAIAAALVLMQMPQGTGIGLHQMAGIALGMGVIVHLILHRKWIVAMRKSFSKPLPAAVRINLLLNILLLVFFLLTCVSGLLNSPMTTAAVSSSPAITSADPSASSIAPKDARSERWGRFASRRESLDHRASVERGTFLWHAIHNLSARLTLLIVIAHLVLRRKWIAGAMKRTRPVPVQAAAGQ